MRSRLLLLAVLPIALVACADGERPVSGPTIYARYCASCHQADGSGIPGAFPSLAVSPWIEGDEGRLVRLLLRGMKGPLERNGERYNNAMPPHAFLTDEQMAAVLTFVRSSFGHDAPPVLPPTVAAVRAAEPAGGAWHPAELEQAVGVPPAAPDG